MEPASPTIPEPGPPRQVRVERVLQALHRFRFVLAPISFGIGLASFLLIERREWIAQWLAVLLLATWLLSLIEVTVSRWLRLPPALLRFLTQQTHQETFFFTLPFLLHTTNWHSAQAIFTGGVLVAAVCSMWDPLYFGAVAKRAWLYLGFHALAVYVVMLVSLPLVLHLTTTQTLALSALAVGLLTVPSIAHIIDRRKLGSWLLMVGGGAALSVLAWLAGPWVPPATLWVSQGVITQTVDVERKEPGLPLTVISPQALQQGGLYAHTAIHVPRGLREQVYHRWLHQGQEQDLIPLEVIGGREEGYRAWSHKTGFPADSLGRWRVQVVTESGQLIGEVRFSVSAESAEPAVEQPVGAEEREAAGDQQPEKAADHEVPVPADIAAPGEENSAGQADQDPDRQQVDPRPAPVPQLPDEKRGESGAGHQDRPPPAAAPVPDSALEPQQLDGAEDKGEDGETDVKPDDGSGVQADPPSPAPSAPGSSSP
jgi:hypothetical protein